MGAISLGTVSLHRVTPRGPGGSAHGLSAPRADDWRDSAACYGQDPEQWFPVGTSGPALLQTEQAKAVCRRCPVVDDCLKWALDTGQDAGIWGATTEEERRALKRRPKTTRTRTTRTGGTTR